MSPALEECLRSVLAHTAPAIPIVIADWAGTQAATDRILEAARHAGASHAHAR